MTLSSSARWYDGHSSARHAVTVTVDGSLVTVTGEGVEISSPLKDLRVDPRLGTVRRMVRFPDGETAEIADETFLDELERRQGKGRFLGRVHRWESSLRRALVALAVTLLLAFSFVRYGLPYLAAKAAFALPPASEELLGRETLQILDRVILKPTALPAARQKELSRLFATMAAGHPERKGWRLEFRSGAIGANAFALPSGIVIVTDRLVEIAKSDDEIAGVLAHEIGHVKLRHALRHLLQNSATALLVATLTGDITSVTSLGATLPTVLIDATYSREFEREADTAAVRYLKEKGTPVRVYAEMLARLDADHWRERDSSPRFGDLFADHPLMEERVRRVVAEDGEK